MDELICELEELMADWAQSLALITYEEMTDFVNRREQLILRMQSLSLSASDRGNYKESINRILQYDQVILPKMHQLKEEALSGTSKISQGRIQKTAYEADYAADSVFFDRKK